eukprot:CAMPEP_0119354740 /NCGR_PEP_ID=MMETSP1334-20130426/3726_1 /TAXON_ID=127549 /ORGANISM="Calcidiscus leptoporus, Strain RCC1130" /LENGTH=98 /DNA_ID=CAMNT_0007368397 /DNA_START=236 /DNA_END=532 /DNA_ORIENTATION=-
MHVVHLADRTKSVAKEALCLLTLRQHAQRAPTVDVGSVVSAFDEQVAAQRAARAGNRSPVEHLPRLLVLSIEREAQPPPARADARRRWQLNLRPRLLG